MSIRNTILASGLLLTAATCHAQPIMLAQERSITLTTSADGQTLQAVAADFRPFAAAVSHVVPVGPVDTGGTVAISCHFERGIALAGTVLARGAAPGGAAASTTAVVHLLLEFRVESPTPVTLTQRGVSTGVTNEELLDLSLRPIGSQRRPILNDSSRTLDASRSLAAVLDPGDYAFRYDATVSVTGPEATRDFSLQLDFGSQPCPADFNQDGGVDGTDVESFFGAWTAGSPAADVNLDGGVDGADVADFIAAWEGGC
jgi:hypothetical protein